MPGVLGRRREAYFWKCDKRTQLFFRREKDECHTKFVPETLRVPASPSTSCTEGTRPPAPGSTFQQRSCERFRCRTRQQTAPPSVARDLGARLEDFRCRLRLVLCQTLHESLRFSKPSSAHFACNDHHPCSSSCPTQFWVPVLLPLPSVPQSHSIGLLSSTAFHLHGAQTPMSRPEPVALLQRGTNLLQSPPTCANSCVMSNSLTMTLVDTLARLRDKSGRQHSPRHNLSC